MLRERTRVVENDSLLRRHPQHAAAALRFDSLPTAGQKMAIVREVAATRNRELTLAYQNVVMVSAGFRSRGSEDGINEVHPEPCVVFVVKLKWNNDSDGEPTQVIPRRLLAYGGSGESRTMYAVPTDVQPASWFVAGVALSESCVRIKEPTPEFRLAGTLTCGVRLRNVDAQHDEEYALSAMHVLSPAPTFTEPSGGLKFSVVGAGAPVGGSSREWGGFIDVEDGTGFDVQLAKIEDAVWFSHAFGELKLSTLRPYVVAPDVFDELAATMRFLILAPDNHPMHMGQAREPMLAQFMALAHGGLPVDYQVRWQGTLQSAPIRHPELILMRVLEDCPAPESGDSGSAVVTWWPDGSIVLVGMLIASGDGPGLERVAYVNPAWQLFDPLNWSRLPSGTIELLPFL